MRTVAAAVAAVVVALAAAGGFLAFRVLHGSADSLITLVPADSAIYVTVNFDPPAGQKLALNGLIARFPGLSDSSRAGTVRSWVDRALTGSGLTYDGDITPWFGSGMSLAIPASALPAMAPHAGTGSPATPAVTVLVASKDDGKAQAALDKFRNGPSAATYHWTTSTHGGVTVTSGSSGSSTTAYTLVSHSVIFATTTAAVEAVIDTAQGKRPNLQSTSAFTTVESQLPGDRVALAYTDVAAVVKALTAGSSTPPAQLQSLSAYRGAGFAVSANSDGIMLTGTEDYDVSRLTADQRAAIAIPPHQNGSLTYVPSTAYGVTAFTGMQQGLRSIIDASAPPGSGLARSLLQLGVTGTDGILNHLSGDAGIEVDRVAGHTEPAGAAMFKTDSSTVAQRFLDNLVSTLCDQSRACDPTMITSQDDKGVQISSIPLSGLDSAGVEPSWAVSDGWAIVGSSPGEVRAALDSHASGTSITTSPTYTAVTGHLGQNSNAMTYLDVSAIAAAIRGVLPPQQQAAYDRDVAPYLAPVKALGVSSQNASDHTTFGVFVLIR
jgi:hypothetical protein